jgi:hydrogenase-4 component F
MVLLILILLPAAAAGAAYLVRPVRLRSVLLIGTALVHVVLAGSLWVGPVAPALRGWLAIDPLGLLVLSLVSILFLVIAVYAVGFLQAESPRGGRVFVSGLLAFLAAATLVAVSHHLGRFRQMSGSDACLMFPIGGAEKQTETSPFDCT